MNLIAILYLVLRAFFGNSSEEPVQLQEPSQRQIGNHSYMVAESSDMPGVTIVGSEMLTQVVLKQGDHSPYKAALTTDAPLAIQVLNTREVMKLKGIGCRYLRGTVEVYFDEDAEERALIKLHNGLYFVIEIHGVTAKILLHVPGGYAAYYVNKHGLTDTVEDTKDYPITGPCPDTMTPERCSSCWPYEHHRPVYLP